VMDEILNNWYAEEVVCSWKLHRKIGEYLHKQGVSGPRNPEIGV